MNNSHLPVVVRQALQGGYQKGRQVAKNPWVRIASFFLLLVFISKIDININLGSPEHPTASLQPNIVYEPRSLEQKSEDYTESKPQARPASYQEEKKPWWKEVRDDAPSLEKQLNLANAATAVGAALTEEQQLAAAKYSNLGFVLNPGLAERKGIDPAIVKLKEKICLDYISSYAPTAQEEAKLFNIPASITLAQGLLESNVGESRLAKKDNNHFGIKCRKKCLGCRCANYTDDSKYDMFRIFDSPWHSFREHSKLLTGARYKHLCRLPRSDYKSWAHGLKKAGYATDPNYGTKLIEIIEALNLQRFDA